MLISRPTSSADTAVVVPMAGDSIIQLHLTRLSLLVIIAALRSPEFPEPHQSHGRMRRHLVTVLVLRSLLYGPEVPGLLLSVVLGRNTATHQVLPQPEYAL